MYDYKFRHSDSTFKKPRCLSRKILLITTGLALVVTVIYAGFQMDFLLKKATTPEAGSGPDVIPLTLPPRLITPQDSSPTRNG